MILWTIQPIEVWNLIQYRGVYRCDSSKSTMVNMGFDEAYKWIALQMEKRVGPPPEGVKFPVWAWYIQNGKHKKPDLRIKRWLYGPGDEDYTCIELEIPDSQVLLSDFDVWHLILDNWFISETEDEENQLEKYYETLSPESQKAFLYKNWERVLDISPLNNNWIIRGECIQATFWELRKEMIRDVKFFRTARHKHDPWEQTSHRRKEPE